MRYVILLSIFAIVHKDACYSPERHWVDYTRPGVLLQDKQPYNAKENLAGR
jgi:hypothetical protein